MDNKPHFVGIPWFAREDYEAFRTLLPDRAWHATFDQWQAAAKQAFDKIKRSNDIRVVKAHVQSDAFAQWCRSTGRDVKARALADYGNDFAARQFFHEQAH